MPEATDADVIKWQLKWLTQHASDDLSEWELNFLISVEAQFKKKGTLTEPQMNKLAEIYERHA